MVDLKRVIAAIKTNQDPLPEEFYKRKMRLALGFALISMDRGMALEDMLDLRQIIFWDNGRYELHIFPRVSQVKRAKWKAALDRPISFESAMRRLSK